MQTASQKCTDKEGRDFEGGVYTKSLTKIAINFMLAKPNVNLKLEKN